ncbi:recombination protein O N-terminal domain-containing protein, partial [Limnohabitans sp. Rim8]|uniref:DNA repair protein RecO n=1 Tax=Limnohabitans sp. Rim8 TaxID=1100718 RepID=UPI0026396008
MATQRITEEPAFVLHRYDWSEASLIVEVFTRHHGRIALVAKGAKRPSSSFRPILLPMQPLHL